VNILTLTTSYPTTNNRASGIFVKRFLENFDGSVVHHVLSPRPSKSNEFFVGEINGRISPCVYFLSKYEKIFHGGGGAPAAISKNPLYTLLIPLVFLSMLYKGLRLASGVDVVHGHWSFCGFIACAVGLFSGKPVVVTLHGQDVNRSEESLVLRGLLFLTVHLSDQVVTVSQGMCDFLHDKFPKYKGKITFISNGVTKNFFEICRVPYQRAGPVNILAVSSLIRSKGLDVIIRAFSCLSNDNSVLLTIVGEGDELTYLNSLVRSLGLANSVVFKGAVEPTSMPLIYADADIFVSASEAEGRPSVLLEAMAASLPVILSDIPAHRELLQVDGRSFFFKSGDAAGLSVHLKAMLGDPSQGRRQGLENKKYLVDSGLSWPETVKKYMLVYKNLM